MRKKQYCINDNCHFAIIKKKTPVMHQNVTFIHNKPYYITFDPILDLYMSIK